jgi:hypothetical protein
VATAKRDDFTLWISPHQNRFSAVRVVGKLRAEIFLKFLRRCSDSLLDSVGWRLYIGRPTVPNQKIPEYPA